jgi:hypothetical protein
MRHYRLTPEPGPVCCNVDPLGEPFGASVFPDGFTVLLAPVARPVVVLEPGEFAVGTPVVAEPVAVPAVELPAPELCASANVLESASAPATAIVASFMFMSFMDFHCR